MTTSFKFNGKEVKNPAIRVLLVAIFVIVGAILITMFGIVVLPLMLAAIVMFALLAVPLHFILRSCGRRGFYVQEGDIHTCTFTGAFERR